MGLNFKPAGLQPDSYKVIQWDGSREMADELIAFFIKNHSDEASYYENYEKGEKNPLLRLDLTEIRREMRLRPTDWIIINSEGIPEMISDYHFRSIYRIFEVQPIPVTDGDPIELVMARVRRALVLTVGMDQVDYICNRLTSAINYHGDQQEGDIVHDD